ncbi:unnamed protein product [Acanthosepion pharaonis]|uniref:Uncharacterized protein n=1 Tax=Acanthosepion pharaonis TaxID=158019 RepID=A0A812D870_ACAPH|nr:unnamed protein product [Sepia pharaonis]
MKLLLNGYTWQDTFAQCIIQNLLISEPDSSDAVDCSIHKSQPLTSNEKLEDNRLDSIINDRSNVAYKMPYSLSSLPLYKYPKSDKRDEIVHVHKYFDKPAIPSRRASGPPEVELIDNYAEDMYPDESDAQIAESPLDPKNLFMSDEAQAPSSALEGNGITAMKRAGSSDATGMNAEEIRQYLDNLEKLLDTNYSLDKSEENTETENQAIDTEVPKSGYAVPNVIADRLQGYEPGVNRLLDIGYDGKNDNGNVNEDDSLSLAAQLQDSIPIPEETSEELIDSLQGEAQDAPVNPEEMVSDAGAVRLMSILGNKGDPIDSPEDTVGTLRDNTALPEEIVEIPEDTIVTPENTLDNLEDSLADDYEDDEIFTTADAEMLQRLLKGSLSLDSLSDKQMTHINKYVNTLLDAINETDEQPEEMNQAVDEDVRDLLKSDKLTPDDAKQLSRVEALMGDSDLVPSEDESQNVFKEPDPDNSVSKKASAVKEKTPGKQCFPHNIFTFYLQYWRLPTFETFLNISSSLFLLYPLLSLSTKSFPPANSVSLSHFLYASIPSPLQFSSYLHFSLPTILLSLFYFSLSFFPSPTATTTMGFASSVSAELLVTTWINLYFLLSSSPPSPKHFSPFLTSQPPSFIFH